jgi:hypothetical protein
MAIKLEVLCSSGHRKYEKLTPEQAEQIVADIEAGKIEGAPKGSYFVINKNTKRLVGKIHFADNQELLMMPVIRGG